MSVLSDPCPEGPNYQLCVDSKNFMDKGLLVGFALSILNTIWVNVILRYLNPDTLLGETIMIAPYLFTTLWSFPVTLYLLYHRVALPFPFGRPITFGGIKPNVCTIHGRCACFSEDLKAWLADLAGPEGWKHLFPQEETLWAFISFVVLNLALLAILQSDMRKPRSYIRKPRSRNTLEGDDKCKDQGADARLLEHGDMEKAITVSGSTTITV
jgi:hypothetical protein